MMRDGVAIGAIAVLRPQKGAFGDKEVEVLKTFADQAVIAIGNVRLFKELEARNREITEALEQQTATSEILRVIASTTTDLQPVFQTIADSAVRLCDGAVGGTMLFDGELIHLAAHRGFTPEGEAAYRGTFPLRPTRANLSGRAIVDRTVVHVPDVEADPSLPISQALHDAQRWRAALSVPMLRDGQPIGAISVARLTPGPFSDKQIALLQAFADQAVIAIENARLLKELEARTAELTRSVDQLIALGEVGRAVTSSLDLDTVLATIVSRAVQLTGLEAGAIYEYDERTETFDLRATERLSEDEVHVLRTVPLRRGEGAVGQTAVTLEPVQVPDITDTRLYESRLRDLLIRSGHRALLAVPLLRESQLIGALVVNRKTPGEFSPEVVELLRTFAAQSVLAIQNARLFREIEDKSRQLEQASRHKSQFLASMSHELRTPLNAILGLNEMLLGEVYGEVPEDMKPPLVQTQASGRHLLGLINNVLDLAKIEANRLDLALAPYVVQDLLASVRATLAPLAAEKGLAFTASAPDDLPVARGDAGRLTQCLINLAGNALKFTKEGRVALRVELVEDRLRFSVADTGIGIAPDKMADLFTEFKQTDATIAREYGGTGLGLAITRKFIELHKGSIWVESELGRGSTFIFEIPLQVPA
jgi:signal transduction histidine kinase